MLKMDDLKITLYCDESKKNDLRKFIAGNLNNYPNLDIIDEYILELSIYRDKKNILNNNDIFFSPMFRIPKEVRSYNNIIKYTFIYDLIPIIIQ